MKVTPTFVRSWVLLCLLLPLPVLRTEEWEGALQTSTKTGRWAWGGGFIQAISQSPPPLLWELNFCGVEYGILENNSKGIHHPFERIHDRGWTGMPTAPMAGHAWESMEPHQGVHGEQPSHLHRPVLGSRIHNPAFYHHMGAWCTQCNSWRLS